MRRKILAATLALLVTLVGPLPTSRAIVPRHPTPPGQINVLAVNAKQVHILGLRRFIRLLELAKSIRRRPPAFDGGLRGAVSIPDIIIVNEISFSNLEILQRLLKQQFNINYKIVGLEEARARYIVNLDAVTPMGEPERWADVCTDPANPHPEFRTRYYQIGRFTENATGQPFTLAGVHFFKDYSATGLPNCHDRNVDELRRRLQNEIPPVIIGGDFNRGPVETQFDCDPQETSTPRSWWSSLTSPADGARVYADAVKHHHTTHGLSMADEWTHEWIKTSPGCDGVPRLKRNRIDFLFSSAVIAEAHADHPGWSGGAPGERHPTNVKYSDHRWVWGRFGISGPPQPARPIVDQLVHGKIQVTWAPVEGATSYLVLRARRGHQYSVVHRTVDALTTGYTDFATEHATTYRYAIAAVGSDTSQGLESRPQWGTADSVGPRLTWVLPHRAQRNVDIRTRIEAHFDEPVDPDSITEKSLAVYFNNGRRVAGRVIRLSKKGIAFDPFFPLKKGVEYHPVVRGLKDMLGNVGPRASWRFTTVPPPPKRPRRR